jgi:hypothetical protein
MPEPNHAFEALLELIFEAEGEHWAVLNSAEGKYQLFASLKEAQAEAKPGDSIVHRMEKFTSPNVRSFTISPVI